MNKKFLIFSIVLAACFTASSVGAYSSPSLASVQYVDSGKRLFDNKDYDRAINDFNKALLADPHNEDALRYLRMLGFGRGGCSSYTKNCPNREQSCGATGSCRDKEMTTNSDRDHSPQKNKNTQKKSTAKFSKADQQKTQHLHAQSLQKEKAALKKLQAQSAKEEAEFFKKVNAEQKAQQAKNNKKNKKQKTPATVQNPSLNNAINPTGSAGTKTLAGSAKTSKSAPEVQSSALTPDESARSLGAIVVSKDAAKGTDSIDEECCDEKMAADPKFSYDDCIAKCKKLKKKAEESAKQTKLKKKKQAKAKKNKKSAEKLNATKAEMMEGKEVSPLALENEVTADESMEKPRGTMKAGMTMKQDAVTKSMALLSSDQEAAKGISATGSDNTENTETSDEDLVNAKAGEDQTPAETITTSKTMKSKMAMKGSGGSSPSPAISSDEGASSEKISAVKSDAGSIDVTTPEDNESLAQQLEPTLTKKQKYELARIRARNAMKERDLIRRLNAESADQEQQVQWKTKTRNARDLSGDVSIDEEAGPVDVKSLSPTDESLAAKNDELRAKMNDMLAMSKHDQDVIEALQGNTKNNDDEVVRLRKDLAQTRDRLENRRTLLKDQADKMRSLQDRLGALEMDVHSKQYDFKDKQLDYDKKIADLEGEFGEYKSESAKNETEFKDHLKTLKDALAQKIAELDAAQEKLLFTEYKLKKRDSQYVAKNDQFDEVKKTLSDLEDRLSGIQGTMKEGDTEVAAINPDNFPPPQTKDEAVYQRWIQRHDKLIAKLKEKLLWAREQIEFLGEYDIKLSDQKMAVLKEQLAEVKKQLSEKANSGSTNPEDQSQVEGKLKDAQDRLGMVEKILQEKNEQIKELEKQLNGVLSTVE